MGVPGNQDSFQNIARIRSQFWYIYLELSFRKFRRKRMKACIALLTVLFVGVGQLPAAAQ